MFKDYPHKNDVILINGKNYFKRTLSSKIMLEKEYFIMKFLQPLKIAPQIFSFKERILIEEYLKGWCPIKQKELTDKIIKSIAITLKKLHSVKLSEEIIQICKDKYTMDLKYHPYEIFKSIEKVARSRNVCCDYKKLEKYFKAVEKKLNECNYMLCLIHGDLSPNNILLKEGKVRIVDWSDCRLDIFTADISQLFYLFKFSESQERLFKNFYDYNPSDLNDSLLLAHKILLVFYDLAADSHLSVDKVAKEIRLESLLKQI